MSSAGAVDSVQHAGSWGSRSGFCLAWGTAYVAGGLWGHMQAGQRVSTLQLPKGALKTKRQAVPSVPSLSPDKASDVRRAGASVSQNSVGDSVQALNLCFSCRCLLSVGSRCAPCTTNLTSFRLARKALSASGSGVETEVGVWVVEARELRFLVNLRMECG